MIAHHDIKIMNVLNPISGKTMLINECEIIVDLYKLCDFNCSYKINFKRKFFNSIGTQEYCSPEWFLDLDNTCYYARGDLIFVYLIDS